MFDPEYDAEVRAAIRVKAAEYGIPEAHVGAIVHEESRGDVFDIIAGKRRPLVLNEPHVLYRLTSGKVRDRLVAEGLAYKAWGTKPYLKSQAARWEWAAQAARIAGEVSYEAMSYGVGQVMGYHWKSLGFSNFQQFMQTALAGAEGQIDLMLRYCVANRLDDELRDGRWEAFFRGYNGPQWKKHGYGKNVPELLIQFGGGKVAEPDGMLRMGAKGKRVRELQALLVRAGINLKVDGDFGPSTKDGVMAFQQARGLKVDGVYGPQTARELENYRASPQDKPGDEKLLDIKGVKEGIGAVVGGTLTASSVEGIKQQVEEAAGEVAGIGIDLPIFDWIGAGLTLAAVGIGVYGTYLAIRGILQSQRTEEV